MQLVTGHYSNSASGCTAGGLASTGGGTLIEIRFQVNVTAPAGAALTNVLHADGRECHGRLGGSVGKIRRRVV
jgi:hypothetical protein